MLTQRWGIFWRRFHFSFDRWSLVALVCMKLHNLCVDRGVPIPLVRYHEDHRHNDEWIVQNNAREDDALFRDRARGNRRREITEDLQHRGIVRPPHAAANNRI